MPCNLKVLASRFKSCRELDVSIWGGGRDSVLPTTNKNVKTICLICNLISTSMMATVSARICCHPKETPKIKAYFILTLYHSMTQSDKAVIISFFACCRGENKKILGRWVSHAREWKLCLRSDTHYAWSKFIHQNYKKFSTHGRRQGNAILTRWPQGRDLKMSGIYY